MKTGKYKICGLLGKGGMGKVYKVQLPVISKIAALKLLEPDPLIVKLMGADTIRDLFISEAVTMARLRHPNIVEILDFDEASGKPFYIMDYYCNNLGLMIGETYRPEMPSRIISIDKAIWYTRQTLMGLACLHHAGIIHRDIKPYNILITDWDTVKICDFGLSRLRGEAFKGPSSLKVGSPWYAAPEQEDNPDEADFSADIYSVGIMLCRMLTGRLPTEETEKPSNINPDLDQEWDMFIKKATEPESQNRFASANAMLEELERLDAAWKEKKENICSIPSDFKTEVQTSGTSEVSDQLRSHNIKVNPLQAPKVFLTDELWRPLHYISNDLTADSDNGIVTDRATGLVWQQSGSEYPVTWDQACAYTDGLNKENFAGHSNWRLPTVDELMSLLTQTPHGEDFCMEPVFDRTQKWLWSCDRRSFMAAWYVSVDMGFVFWQDFSGYYYVRGVCTLS